ncbi:2290_t:CDS:2 [Dentiscutata erythropus]|uniref:2290_t:CDS:1 n=1 Tax=Dentiscutata erythropus TaxID=1348616 RepID=A0A9N8WA54_9GLOM|nr:2290_t:CDS:2 [Dentiscutata erythropus]
MSDETDVGGAGAAANQAANAIKELETTCRDLQFGIIVSMEDKKLEEKSLSEDVVKMTEFLKTIEGGVTDANNQLKENNEILYNLNTGVGTVMEHTDEIKIKLNAIFEEVIEIKKKVYKREISLGAPHIDINCLDELAFQQIPYKTMDTMDICEHVKSGKRERFNFIGKYAGIKEVINGYSKIIVAAWAHEPAERPSINVFNFELKKLNGLINSVEDSNPSDDVTDDEGGPFVSDDIPHLIPPLEDAVINGNPSALFNYGDLFLNGKLGIKKDEDKGIRYLKMAAVKGQPKALEELKKRKISL